MDHFNRFRQYLAINTFLAIWLPGLAAFAIFFVLRKILGWDFTVAGLVSVGAYMLGATLSYIGLMNTSTGPLKMVWQAIWHVSPGRSDVPPPKVDDIKIKAARELVGAMVMQVYDLASSRPLTEAAPSPSLATAAPQTPKTATQPTDNNGLLESLPLPTLLLDKDWNIRTTNSATLKFLGLERDKVIGNSINNVLRISFRDGVRSLEEWLGDIKGNKATDTHSWEDVKLDGADDSGTKKFDMAASYSQDNPSGNEAILVLFDRSTSYNTEEQATSYIAMAVHELRTPLTMLRGYVEMFEDEIGPSLSSEHQEYVRKMSASTQSLSAFVGNILNVARIDGNQLVLKLEEANWKETLNHIVDDLQLRAQVRGKRLSVHIDDDLPNVAVDKVSIAEVVTNLVENAIKYSGPNPDIEVYAKLNRDGMIETTVEDHGAGIPANVVGGLFTKYYRSHRSKNAVAGTGLGLYLVKNLVTAHGGQVGVESKEGEGSKFSFTLAPYDKIKDQQTPGHDGIERNASGWIKNHSLYRR